MARSRTKPSTRKLSDIARHVVIPDGIVTTGYPSVERQCRDMGIVHDDWQQGLGRLILGKRADGKYAATVGGVVLSISRQVGKTFLIGSIVFALCILFPGMTVLWTAHRARLSNETFAKMQAMARRKKIAPFVRSVRVANGEQEITFTNGSRILFGAREQGFGVGFDEVDVIVFDEAQRLKESALDDMIPATNQSRQPSGALVFYMGTPPRPTDVGEAFTAKRRKALSGKSKDMVYVEMSADQDASPDDHKQWAKANPSFPHRTPVESMERMRENLASDESFVREGLGVWDEDETDERTLLNYATWSELADVDSKIEGSPTIGVAMSWDRSKAAVGAAGGAGLRTHVEPIAYQRLQDRWDVDKGEGLRGEDGLKAFVVRLHREHGADVVIDEKGPAGSLVDDLRDELGSSLIVTKLGDALDAVAAFLEAVDSGGLVHMNDPDLNTSAAGARKRFVSDRPALDRRRSKSDIAPLESVLLPAWRVIDEGGYDVMASTL